MEKIDKDSKNILIGAAVGGIIGLCVGSVLFGSKREAKKEKTSLGNLGNLVDQIGEVLSSHDVKEPPFVKKIEKEVHRHENTIVDVLDMVSSGLHLWERIKKG